MTAILAGIFIYPVKSAAGIACNEAVLDAHGFQHDREWMVVDAAGRFVTQRNEARLALLGTAIADGRLRLSSPAGAGPALDLQHEGDTQQVQVWGASVPAFDAGAEAAQFLSDWLGRPLRLVRFDTRHRRLSNQDWTAGREVSTLFSDGYPMLVLSQASIADLAARVGHELPVQRFRPNLLIGGVPAYAEDAAEELTLGEVRIALTKGLHALRDHHHRSHYRRAHRRGAAADAEALSLRCCAARRGIRPQCVCCGWYWQQAAHWRRRAAAAVISR